MRACQVQNSEFRQLFFSQIHSRRHHGSFFRGWPRRSASSPPISSRNTSTIQRTSYASITSPSERPCRKIYELGYVPICPRFGFLPFLDEGEAEDQQAYNRMSHLILKRCRMVVVCGKEVTGTMNTDISTADRLHIICTTLDGLIKIKEKES